MAGDYIVTIPVTVRIVEGENHETRICERPLNEQTDEQLRMTAGSIIRNMMENGSSYYQRTLVKVG